MVLFWYIFGTFIKKTYWIPNNLLNAILQHAQPNRCYNITTSTSILTLSAEILHWMSLSGKLFSLLWTIWSAFTDTQRTVRCHIKCSSRRGIWWGQPCLQTRLSSSCPRPADISWSSTILTSTLSQMIWMVSRSVKYKFTNSKVVIMGFSYHG